MLRPKTHQNPTSEVAEQFLSILIPAYNAENWIADTLESAIAQTWPRQLL